MEATLDDAAVLQGMQKGQGDDVVVGQGGSGNMVGGGDGATMGIVLSGVETTSF